MTIKTAKGNEFDCDSVTFIPSPPRLYFHLVNVSLGEVMTTFYEKGQLPVEGYPMFTNVQCIVAEGAARVKVSLKN